MKGTAFGKIIVIGIITLLVRVFVVPSSGLATIIYIPGDWAPIQIGIDGAADGDTVLVAEGHYHQRINFDGKGILVTSKFMIDGDTLHIKNTIIDGDSSGRVVTFANGEDSSSIIQGFTIQNGAANTGGGIYCYGSSPTITNCTISGNTTTYNGTGVLLYSGGSATISNCTISGNTGHEGGGVCCYGYSPTITNCTISGNTASWGGGVCSFFSDFLTITNCIISGNRAHPRGGGIFLAYCRSAAISNCVIWGNTATEVGGGVHYLEEASSTITNCTISGNKANWGGGVFLYSRCSATISNCILWGDTATYDQEISAFDGEVTVSYSDIEGSWPGEGNIDCDPCFCYPDTVNYYLAVNSCCVAAGKNGEEIGALGIGCGCMTMPIMGTGSDIAFEGGSPEGGLCTLAVLNFQSERLDSVRICPYTRTFPPEIPKGSKWVHRYHSIIPIPEDSSFEATLTLFYGQSEFDNSGLLDETELGLCKYDESESTWTFRGATVDTAANLVSLSGVTEFSLWAITDSSNAVVGASASDEAKKLPIECKLSQNYPNPFNPTTLIEYDLPVDCHIKLTIYNILGQKVATLVDGNQKAGYKRARWDAGSLCSGIYFYRLQAGDFVQTRKMVVLK